MPDHADENGWGVDRLDVPAYLARIGVPDPGEARPSDGLLQAVHRAHVAAIPFENIDIVLGRTVSTDLHDLQAKMVDGGRGGYCHEHGVLFAAVLDRLGFRVERLLARLGDRPYDPLPRTHLALRVHTPDHVWLADVGYGTGLLEPLHWASTSWHDQGAWSFRTRPEAGRLYLEERTEAGATALYTLMDDRQSPSDVLVANHFTATHPRSPFVGQLVVMRRDDHDVLRLIDRDLVTRKSDGTSTERELDDREIADVLRGDFGIRLDDKEIDGLLTALPY